jgi:methyltransferase family protein
MSMVDNKNYYNSEFYNSHSDGSLNSALVILGLLWKFYQPESLVDFGCGKGTWLYAAKLLGSKKLKGYDGEWVKDQIIDKQIDFTPIDLEDIKIVPQKYDLAISVEVAEHLSKGSEIELIKALCNSSDIILFSAAVENQGGTNHINENPQSYWINLFEKEGFFCLDYFRPLIWENELVEWWYRQNIFLFVNRAAPIPFEVENFKNSTEEIYNAIHPELLNHRTQEIKEKDNLLNQQKELISQKEEAIKIMKASKFWKLRDFYLKIRNKFRWA